MYGIYGNMNPINIPQMLAYIPAPWIRHGYLEGFHSWDGMTEDGSDPKSQDLQTSAAQCCAALDTFKATAGRWMPGMPEESNLGSYQQNGARFTNMLLWHAVTYHDN